MFQTVRLSIIRSFSLYTQQWYMSYRFADSLRAGSGWNALISQIYSWNETLHVSESSSVHHQEFFTVHTAMVYVIQVCWHLASRIRMERIDFSNLFLEWNPTCFGEFLCPSSGVFHCTHCSGICHTGLLTACEQDQDGTHWFLKFILGMKLYMFRTVPLSIIRGFHCTHSNGICYIGLLTACEQDQDGTQFHPDPVWHIPVFLNRRAAARYRALASIIPGGPREVLLEVVIFVFWAFFINECFIVEIFWGE